MNVYPIMYTHYIFRISKLSFLHPAKLRGFLNGQKYLPAFDLQGVWKILPDEKIDNFSGDKKRGYPKYIFIHQNLTFQFVPLTDYSIIFNYSLILNCRKKNIISEILREKVNS